MEASQMVLLTEEQSLQKDVIHSYLSRETEKWLGARALADRAVCLDARLNTERDKHLDKIHTMLEELIEIPGVRVEQVSDGTT